MVRWQTHVDCYNKALESRMIGVRIVNDGLREYGLELLRRQQCRHDALVIPVGNKIISHRFGNRNKLKITFPKSVKPLPATNPSAAIKVVPRSRGW